MADTSAYYAALRTEKARLDAAHPEGFLFTTSVRNFTANGTAGSVAEVSTQRAAETIIAGSHRESTPQEIDAFKRAGELFAAAMRAADEKRNPAMGRVLLMPDMPDKGGK